MILQLHKGEAPEAVKAQLSRLLGEVPYDMVVEVEQELMNEGLSVDDVLKMCDIHSAALRGNISKNTAKEAPPGHPIYTFQQENKALQWEIASVKKLFDYIKSQTSKSIDEAVINQVKLHFNSLADVEKHYRRKENLLFPFMEKHGITGPPKVMWGKHDETRELMKSAAISLKEISGVDKEQLAAVIELVLIPELNSIEEMIYKMGRDFISDVHGYADGRRVVSYLYPEHRNRILPVRPDPRMETGCDFRDGKCPRTTRPDPIAKRQPQYR